MTDKRKESWAAAGRAGHSAGRGDLTDRRFGLLVVIGIDKKPRNGSRYRWWLCRCDCGNTSSVRTSKLVGEETRSCGCRNGRPGGKGHGKCKTEEYHVWQSMIQRCHNEKHPAWKDYGGRGIVVCSRWRHSFEAFLEDVGPRPGHLLSIDRANNDGNYEPSNVRWATSKQQRCNQRGGVIEISFRGESLSVAEWSKRATFPEQLIRRRLRSGWSAERTLTTPRPIPHSYQGLTVGGWATRLGVAPSTLHRRVSKGWSLKKAVTTPVKGAGK